VSGPSPTPILPTSNTILIDDRLLVAHLVGADLQLPEHSSIATTTYWYYRACRAAVAGGTGQLSGPFQALAGPQQAAAIAAMLRLPDRIALPGPRQLVPEMVAVHRRYPQLNMMNIEATAAARLLATRVALSTAAARGVLAVVLDEEHIKWDIIDPS
jgi:hypothetical protein